MNDRNGKWIDDMGCCKVCDGEIPYGHTYNCDIFKLEQEISRLKRGDFTELEFQNLCHKFNEDDKTRFCNGCEEYQKKLFGASPITELKEKAWKYDELNK